MLNHKANSRKGKGHLKFCQKHGSEVLNDLVAHRFFYGFLEMSFWVLLSHMTCFQLVSCEC